MQVSVWSLSISFCTTFPPPDERRQSRPWLVNSYQAEAWCWTNLREGPKTLKERKRLGEPAGLRTSTFTAHIIAIGAVNDACFTH